jgi:hypothetical protein
MFGAWNKNDKNPLKFKNEKNRQCPEIFREMGKGKAAIKQGIDSIAASKTIELKKFFRLTNIKS